MRDDVLIGEQYFVQDGPDSLYNIHSVTKSVVSILFGIATDKGWITNLDKTVSDYLTAYMNPIPPASSGVSIRHLLTMSGGFQWDETNDLGPWTYYSNPIAAILKLPIVSYPGTQFHYNTGACELLSGIFKIGTDQNLYDFAKENLFAPLGITGPRRWDTDLLGLNRGGYTLYLTPLDMLRIGQLCLHEGQWNGKQIVSAGWIRESTSARIPVSPPYTSYGYLWWVGASNNYSYYYANGYGGQFIFIVPARNLVIVARSDWNQMLKTSDQQWAETWDIIVNHVLPAVQQ
jgi:CubicO group peptidase (beta-lactamase class C family)